jgi:protein-L-isoaspartate(D-aspartate) O-methyltransferase
MPSDPELDAYSSERLKMVAAQLQARGIRDERVLNAMARLPRHEFITAKYRDQAYEDHPIPIGEGQTISQPYIVALMTEVLALSSNDKVLEVGTGSGYQTAILAELAREVISIERHPALAEAALVLLARLGYTNVRIIVGDGSAGVPESAPYDAIMVAAASPQIPAALWRQLAESGRLVIPVGPPEAQELQLIRNVNGTPMMRRIEGCRFVPLIGEQGYKPES